MNSILESLWIENDHDLWGGPTDDFIWIPHDLDESTGFYVTAGEAHVFLTKKEDHTYITAPEDHKFNAGGDD